jgi:crotonyl-CoA reductase
MSQVEAVCTVGSVLERALDGELPSSYRAAHLAREDAGLFEGVADKDVRRSIRVGEVPLPELAPDEALVAVMASAVNYNTVWSAMFEPIPTFRFLQALARGGGWDARHDLPTHAIGSDAAGIVVRVGAGVRHWRSGHRVVVAPLWLNEQEPIAQVDGMLAESQLAWGFETNFGGLADLAIVKASQLLPKPAHLSWEEAACNSLCLVTAYRMLVSQRAVQFKQGDIVLIWGAAGGLGSYAVQLVANGGGIPIGVVSSPARAELLERVGCEVVLRRDELGLDDLPPRERGKRLGGAIRAAVGEDPHVVFDYIGRETFADSLYVLRRGGAVVTCGSSSGYHHTFDNRYLWMKLKRIIGSHGANAQEAAEATRLLARGSIVPALSRVYPLEQVGEAAREVQLNRHVGKIGVLCLAEREGLGIEDPVRREQIGEERLRLFRELA